MDQLIIKVTGSVTESNFKQYRDEILKKISGINTDLKTDEDYSVAKKTVVICKDAETHLDVALHQAISDAAEISELFDSVRTVILTLRTARLDLSRKVKDEEQIRRAKIIMDAKQSVRDFLAKQVPVIRNMSIDEREIDIAAKGKRGESGVFKAVTLAATEMMEEIKITCNRVGDNDLIFHTIATSHQSLFPDHDQIIFLPELEMVEKIEARIAKANLEEEQRKQAKANLEEATAIIEPTTTSAPAVKQTGLPVTGKNEESSMYQAVINFSGSVVAVKSIYSDLEHLLAEHDEVVSATLKKI